ncbi:MAG: hypothetical protein JSV91_06110 [Phycisphaerales bacterium]|nr:MAG: hypothetical protein JSV91_06110 [Phycisphaerales bacterium]
MRRRVDVQRRSFVLIAVLVIGGGALLVATSLLFLSQADVTAAAAVADAAQSRALAVSGVQAVMSRLDDQRDRILDGEPPRLDSQYEIYETGPRLGIVRLLPLGPGGLRLIPEAGRLDLNTADAAALVATGLVEEPTAQVIIACRDQTLGRPFQSVAELLRADGVTAEILYGPIDELTIMDEAQLEEGDILERIADRLGDDAPRGLADVVTVYAFEPAIQRNGARRINLNVEWSDELGRRVEDRFGPEASRILKQVFDVGTKFQSDATIFQVLRSMNVPPEDWPNIIDAFTTEAGEYHFGRLDINTAPLEALLALPGLTPEQANQIVDVRRDLSPDEIATIAWPAVFGIVEPEAYDDLAGRITTRSWTYRLRIAAGEVDADEPDGPLTNPVIYEAVIDLAAPRARVAYLRDITMLQTAALLASAMPAASPEDEQILPDGGYDDIEDTELPESEDDPDFGLDLDEPAGFDDVMTMDDLNEDFADEKGLDAAEADTLPAGGATTTDPEESADPDTRNRIGRWRFGR